MDVGQITKEWFEENEPEGALSETLLRCLFVGYIIKRPGFILLGETCFWDGRKVAFVPKEHANAWYLYFWSSTNPMSSYELCCEAPFSLEWVCFKRRNKVKALSWERLYMKDFKTLERIPSHGWST